MVRPRQFDREQALEKATQVFWGRGFAGVSTDDLRNAMGIGRQSLYNTFGDKRRLYLEVFERYQTKVLGGHLSRLQTPSSALEGLHELLRGLAAADPGARAMGCFGVSAVAEFGTSDAELNRITEKTRLLLSQHVTAKVLEAQEDGEIPADMDADRATAYVMLSMVGLQVAARAGADLKSMHRMAEFAIDRIAVG